MPTVTHYTDNSSSRRRLTILGTVTLAHVLALAACTATDGSAPQSADAGKSYERVTTVDIEEPADLAAPAVGEAQSIIVTGARRASNSYDSPAYVMPVQTATDPGRERYEGKEVSAVKLTGMEPVSTFSVDVDSGAYTNTRRFLNQGMLPPKAAVRTEEMINYFRYDYPRPISTKTPFSVTT
ncbi:MAG: von Willebrand factor type A domain-containing protein, partial [Pseudomonadota bacterium]